MWLRHPVNYSKNIKVDKAITRLRLGTSLLPPSMGQHIKGVEPKLSPVQGGICYTSPVLLFECSQMESQRRMMADSLKTAGLGYSAQFILNPTINNSKYVFSVLEKFLLDCWLTDKI